MKKIKINLSSTSCQKAINELKNIKNILNKINNEFIYESLEWIKNRANDYLNNRVKNFPNTANIEQYWVINQLGNGHWELRNTSPVGAYVEFGVGLVGSNRPHESSYQSNYKYDVNNHGDKGWNWKNEEYGISMYGFRGYEGKSFLYDAFFDYHYNFEYKRIFKMVYSKYIK